MTKQVALALQAQQAAPPPMLLRQQLGAQAMDWNEAPMASSANYTNAATLRG